ncbi:hypothetical protein JCM11641_003125 [Rhodosporidiobolus odoratus]
MGFCRRCGEITLADRCKCGGTSRDSTTKTLFGPSSSDKWSARYVARTSNTTPPNTDPTPTPPAARQQDPSESPGRTRLPPARPASPSKLHSSFIRQQENSDELSGVFGSVLSPQDHWCCAACEVPFRQEETIYPHPDHKKDIKLAELFFCRQCFAQSFRKGNCKKCKLAVLSDAPFVKHDGKLWHEACYVCSYCTNPSTSAIIDFAGRPSCEACFDGEAYRKNGIAPSPHLSQSEFLKMPVSVPPAPSKWGRPSSTSSPPKARPTPKTSVWSATLPVTSETSGLVGLGVQSSESSSADLKPKAWRVQQERDRSPIVTSLNELGERLRKAGFEDVPRSSSPTEAGASRSPVTIATPASTTALRPVSPIKNVNKSAPWAAAHGRSWSTPVAKLPSSSASPARPVLAPVQPSSANLRPVSTAASSASKSQDFPANPSSPAQAGSEELCPVCEKDLGYGKFVELPKTGQLMHHDCFRCEGCDKALGAGKHAEVEGKWWHQACTPPPTRYRAIVTSLAEPELPIDSASRSPAPILTSPLESDEPSCFACGQLLGYGRSLTAPKSGKRYHQECFTCAKCEGPFAATVGERGFVEVGGLAYHDKCAPPPASPSPGIRSSPFFAADVSTLSASRTVRPLSHPTLPSFPPRHIPPEPLSPFSQPSVFSRRPRPPAGLGGLLVCAGCGVRATEKETKAGPRSRRYHPTCLVCVDCGRGLDSECRVGADAKLRCESCRKTEARLSQRSTLTVVSAGRL